MKIFALIKAVDLIKQIPPFKTLCVWRNRNE